MCLSRAISIGRRGTTEKIFFRASGVPRRGVEHLRGGESELLRSATGWRKEKQRGRFQLASPAVRVAIVPLSILANLVRAVLVRARGTKRVSR